MFENSDRFIRVTEASEMTGLSKPTLYRLAKNGKMPPLVRLSARVQGWRHSTLKDWVKEQEAIANAKRELQKEAAQNDGGQKETPLAS